MNSIVHAIADHLGVPQSAVRNDSFVWYCPRHSDGKKSFQCSAGDNQEVVMRCFAHCSTYKELRAHLRAEGVDIPGPPDDDVDLSRPSQPIKRRSSANGEDDGEPKEWKNFDTEYGDFSLNCYTKWNDVKVVKVYPYRDLDRKLVKFQVRFSYWYLEENGERVEETKEIRKYKRELGRNKHGWKNTPDIPYMYPELVEAAEAGRPIYLVEGEKDVDNMVEHWGVVATTVGSASNTWQTEWCEKMQGCKGVIVIADNDGLKKKKNTGLETANKNAAIIKNAGLPVKLIMFPDVKDVSDFIAAGRTWEEFAEIQSNTPLWTMPDYTLPPSIAPAPPATKEEAELEEWEKLRTYLDTDSRNAERFAQHFGHLCRWVPERNEWFVYNGKLWEADTSQTVVRWAKTISKRIIADEGKRAIDYEERIQLQKWAKNCQQVSYVKRMLYAAQELLIAHLNEFDADNTKHLLNCLDGTINLRTGVCESHDSKNLITKICPFHFSKRKPELWLKHLSRTFDNDQATVDYFQALMGYTFTGYTWFKKYQMWFGPGDTGKSITQDVFFTLGGSYAASLDSTSLMETKVRSAGAEDDIARTKGSRFIFSPEVKQNQVLDETVVKAITGGDVINVKLMHGAKFPLRGTAKLIFTGNERFKTGTNQAIQNRKLEIPFLCIVERKDMIDDFDEMILQQEGDAILGWLAEGARKALAKEIDLYAPPDKVQAATEESKQESAAVDICQDFIDNCVSFLDGGREVVHEVYQKFAKYAHESGVKPPPKWVFGRAMAKHGHNGDGWQRISNDVVKRAYKNIKVIDP